MKNDMKDEENNILMLICIGLVCLILFAATTFLKIM